MAAIIAAGLHGVDRRLPLEEPAVGNPSSGARLPETLSDAVDLWSASTVAKDAFGAEMVAHYGHAARLEWQRFSRSVTDWELARGFER
jgi:glutamine synthetase